MNPYMSLLQGWRLILAAFVMMLVMAGCSGDKGDPGPQGPPGTPGTGVVPVSSTTELAISITGVTVSSPPVVEFTVTNEDGFPVGGLSTADLRFTFAKLVPGSNGSPSYWQSYVVRTRTGVTGSPGEGVVMVQATRDQDGTLVDNLNGSYTYTFQTDVTNVVCPAPCTDAGGNPLDLTYQPNLTHRLGIQTRGSLPMVNSVYTFVPATNTVVASGREIVKTESCNECHNELEAHDARIETGYCVTCHNPGSTDPSSGNTVDFKVMVHKIHRGEDLPSVVGGGEYAIWGFSGKHDYSTVVFPQDIRNCTKCHDGSDPGTPQGDAWQTPSIAACGSCHDDVNFADGTNHDGGAQTDATCLTCHDGVVAKTPAEAHFIPVKLASTKFQYNILTICGTAIDANPVCGPGVAPTVTFSVSDPTGGLHGYGTNYDVAGPAVADRDPEFGSGASLNILTAWNTRDYTNEDGNGTRPSRANSSSALTGAIATPAADGTFEITLDTIPLTATGSGAIAIEGHPLGESDPVGAPGVFDISVPVKGEVAYFAITDTAPVPRRVAVDVTTKCDNCHDQLSIHGNNRAENAQLCVLCHNPRGTDVNRRPKSGGIPDDTVTLDGKREESIDLKRLIHAIHAGQRDDPATSTIEGHGFREEGIVIYGFGGTAHDFGHVRFPGILNDCTTCHNDGAYELTGIWETPTQNGILASSMETVPTATDGATYNTEVADQTNDLTISPTAAVCSACHDSALAQVHMEDQGGAQFNVLQSAITGRETCSICHGPGRVADINVVHGIE